jgi:hypothetical protein
LNVKVYVPGHADVAGKEGLKLPVMLLSLGRPVTDKLTLTLPGGVVQLRVVDPVPPGDTVTVAGDACMVNVGEEPEIL